MYQITSGKLDKAQKFVIYGNEGVGKTTLCSKFPDPLFIDTEDSSCKLDVKRFPKPTSWQMLLDEVRQVPSTGCKTLVVDTLDWAEHLAVKHICERDHKNSIEDYGFGKGYVILRETFTELLNALQELVEQGINVVCTAHSTIRKIELPDDAGAYDKYELKLGKQTSPLVKEWTDTLLFCTFKTKTVINKDEKRKAVGGKERIMYTSHAACWDAKNRDGLADELPLDYENIKHIVYSGLESPKPKTETAEKPKENPLIAQIEEQMKRDDVFDAVIETLCAEKWPNTCAGKKWREYPERFLQKVLIDKWDIFKAKVSRDGIPF